MNQNVKRQVKGGVRQFIQEHYAPYEGDSSFLCGPTKKTLNVLLATEELLNEERLMGKPKVALDRISGINAFGPGYIFKENEVIVGLQTDEPLKRMVNPFGGTKMVYDALGAYDLKLDDSVAQSLKGMYTHNDAVFAAYTDEMRAARSAGLITGLPDAYGRGRIIGDYRRVALFGTSALISDKKEQLAILESLGNHGSQDSQIILEVKLQIAALEALTLMAKTYDYCIEEPAVDAYQAVQHLYFAYLAGVKENNGAAMSLGRVSTFLDVYIEADITRGKLDEEHAQELIDQFVLKLRLVRHLRTPEYDALFAGDPNWVTEALGGMGLDGRTLVSKTTFRFLHTLVNLGASPEPNMTILWSEALPETFKAYCAELSIATSALQYENDDLMREHYGDDYAIACCVSAMKLGEQMQFFGARCNLPKVLLYAINGGIDEMSKKPVLKGLNGLKGLDGNCDSDGIDFDIVMPLFLEALDKTAKLYVETMNIIHASHDLHAYESSLMALHDTEVGRLMAFGVAGLSIVADSLSAIRYGMVQPVWQDGVAVDFTIEGDYPKYGNDDDDVDLLAVQIVEHFSRCLKKYPAYRGAQQTLSVLTITSNVVYGKKTGNTPDGRKIGEPFAPGANPLHGRELLGPLASMNSVAKIPYAGCADDGISYTFSVVPSALGKTWETRVAILQSLIDSYFFSGGHHINVNVLDRSLLAAAMAQPEAYPNLTIRVSGYAVHFVRLTKEQQLEVLARCYHNELGVVLL